MNFKFEIGDEVVCIRANGTWFSTLPPEYVYTVTGIEYDKGEDDVFVAIKEYDEQVNHGSTEIGWCASRFDFARDGEE